MLHDLSEALKVGTDRSLMAEEMLIGYYGLQKSHINEVNTLPFHAKVQSTKGSKP